MNEHDSTEDDELDGCEDVDFAKDPVSDDDLDAYVLFGDDSDVEEKKAAWEELFHA